MKYATFDQLHQELADKELVGREMTKIADLFVLSKPDLFKLHLCRKELNATKVGVLHMYLSVLCINLNTLLRLCGIMCW